jgi:hypothetical protein
MKIYLSICVWIALLQAVYPQTKSPFPYADVVIKYRIYPDGLAPYPTYSIEIHSNGNVIYHGERDVFVKGLKTGKVTPADFQGLLQRFHSQKFSTWEAVYPSSRTSKDGTGCITLDHATQDLILIEHGKEKRVRDTGLAPHAFYELLNAVKSASQVKKWLSINDEVVAGWMAHGWDAKLYGLRTLYAAIQARDSALVRRLIAAGVPVDKPFSPDDLRELPPIFSAAGSGNVDIVRSLVDAGASVTVKDEESGTTPLHFAWDADTIDFLIAHGADVNSHDKRDTPLIDAVRWGSFDTISALLKAGADVEIADQNGSTAITFAKKRVDESMKQSLCDDPADVAAERDRAKKILALLTGATIS